MTDYLSKISPRVRDNIKTWYDQAGVPIGADGKRDGPSDEAKAFENLKLMASLLSEGIPAGEVASLNLVFAANTDVSVSALIKVARDKRDDPAIKDYLVLLKKALLPAGDGSARKEGDPTPEERALAGSKLLYESTAIATTLLATFGKSISKEELASATERYERALGRKLNDDEKFA